MVVALSLGSPVCAQNKFPDYPVRQPGDYAITTERAGLSLGIQPVEDLPEQRTYFRTDVATLGIVPVFVVIHNATNGDSFLFDKTKVTYGPADSTVSTPKTGSKAGQALALSAIPFVGIWPALRVVSNVSQVQQNLLKKELQSTTLSPGASAHGFLYIPVQKDAPRQKLHLRVPITKAGTDEAIVLDLDF